jgi:hypothetical protein
MQVEVVVQIRILLLVSYLQEVLEEEVMAA